jgi:hypothetical protein
VKSSDPIVARAFLDPYRVDILTQWLADHAIQGSAIFITKGSFIYFEPKDQNPDEDFLTQI